MLRFATARRLTLFLALFLLLTLVLTVGWSTLSADVLFVQSCNPDVSECQFFVPLVLDTGRDPAAAPQIVIHADRQTGEAPLTVAFSITNNGGPISSYAWEFGNGGSSTSDSPTTTYGRDGAYDVRLTVTGPGGSDTVTMPQMIVVDPRDIEAGEYNMVGGRLTNVAASLLYRDSFSFYGQKLQVKTECFLGVDADCDTGLLVVFDGAAYYNDDVEEGNPDSYVCPTCRTGPIAPPVFCGVEPGCRVEIYVHSQVRSTSLATLYVDTGDGWSVHATEQFGGSLIKVGPLQQGDTMQVQTVNRSNGGSGNNNNTHMVLFDMESAKHGAFPGRIYNNDPLGSSDWDASIPIEDNNWGGLNNFVLLGKTNSSSASNLGVEARVDLVHLPLNTDNMEAAFPDGGGEGSPLALSPGRYYAWVYAKTDRPIGEGNINAADLMPSDKCDYDYYRGELNDLAFALHAERRTPVVGGGTSWQAITPVRTVLKASLGSAPGAGWNLFLVELEVDRTAEYRLVAESSGKDPTLTFFNKWRARRNPDSNVLSVASFNTLYDDGKQEEKMKNAANLLATKGNIILGPRIVEELPSRAPWQWEVDIVGLQEVKRVFSEIDSLDEFFLPPYYMKLANIFEQEAELRGPRRWEYVRGRDEDFEFKSGGLGPVFIADNLWPNQLSNNSIYFSGAAKEHAECRLVGTLNYAECWLEGEGGIRAAFNFAVPGKAQAPRFESGDDRPVTVFNTHLEFESSDFLSMGETAHHRLKEMKELIWTADRLLEIEPQAFNHASGNASRTTPQFYQNRFIVIGDFNMNSHTCGEYYWLLKLLRDHYGYAIDVATTVYADGNHMGAHDRIGDNAPPAAPYQSIKDWRDNYPAASTYPWWATTYRGAGDAPNKKGERYDAIFLVGKGWAYDDPVLHYEVMSDRDAASPLNPSGGGVEMWKEGSGLVSNGNGNYAPRYDLGQGTGSGRAALHSDHLPVLARLRLFER